MVRRSIHVTTDGSKEGLVGFFFASGWSLQQLLGLQRKRELCHLLHAIYKRAHWGAQDSSPGSNSSVI